MKKVKKLAIKSLVYRIYSVVIAWTVIFLLTGEPETTSYITIILEIIKTIGYITFHKLWDYYVNRRRKIL